MSSSSSRTWQMFFSFVITHHTNACILFQQWQQRPCRDELTILCCIPRRCFWPFRTPSISATFAIHPFRVSILFRHVLNHWMIKKASIIHKNLYSSAACTWKIGMASNRSKQVAIVIIHKRQLSLHTSGNYFFPPSSFKKSSFLPFFRNSYSSISYPTTCVN